MSETTLLHIVAHLEEVRPDVVVIDSIQTPHDPSMGSAPGSVGQIRECANRLVAHAKATGTAVLLVGHVTKEGTLAGPRVLEHVVDTVLEFDGDRHHGLRLVSGEASVRGNDRGRLLQMDITASSPSMIPAVCFWPTGSLGCLVRRSWQPSMATARC